MTYEAKTVPSGGVACGRGERSGGGLGSSSGSEVT
jgi:hypothetical protein